MDNVANYIVVVGGLLVSGYPTLFWNPFVAHCVDLISEDIEKIDFIKDTH